MKYCILNAKNIELLVSQVNDVLEGGWEPLGGVAFTGGCWAQALLFRGDGAKLPKDRRLVEAGAPAVAATKVKIEPEQSACACGTYLLHKDSGPITDPKTRIRHHHDKCEHVEDEQR